MRAVLAITLLLLLAACGPPAPRPPSADRTAQLALGREIYNFRCYYCHGYSGDAKTLAATFVSPAPRDFTAAPALSIEHVAQAVTHGRPGTAMAAFRGTLGPEEIAAVAAFVHDEFVVRKAENTRYHTAENGWPDHERYRAAYPFARGELPLDAPTSTLDPAQLAGRRLFMSACVSCHDRSRVDDPGATWELRAVSYPPNRDACTGCHRYAAALHDRTAIAPAVGADAAGPYDLHDRAPLLAAAPTTQVRRGEALFQKNCAFCHAADGTGRNWIGTFLEPHARDLTDPAFHRRMDHRTLVRVIRDGLPDTAMPAWRTVLAPDEIDAVAAYVLAALRPMTLVSAR